MDIHKKKINNFFHKAMSIFVSLLMVFSCINLTEIQNVHADDDESGYVATTTVTTWSESVNLPSLGKTTPVYHIQLNGNNALCMDLGQHCRSGKVYMRTGVITDSRMKKAANRAFTNTSDSDYILSQAIVWCLEKDANMSNRKIAETVAEVYEGLGYGAQTENMIASYEAIVESIFNNPEPSGTFYIYSCGTASWQRLITKEDGTYIRPEYDDVSSSKSYSVTDKVTLNINKTDAETGTSLSGFAFDIYKDSKKATTVTTDSSGKASYLFSTECSETGSATEEYCTNYDELPLQLQPSGVYTSKSSAQAAADAEALAIAKEKVEIKLAEKHTYKAVEVRSRKGYYINDSNEKSTSYASGDGSGSVALSFSNHTQKATVKIVKEDSETGNGVKGAIYGLFAKTDVTYLDGSGKVKFNAVDPANANASNAAYTFPATDANGEAEISNVYLGHYYIKEITASNKYIKDNSTYDCNLVYEEGTGSNQYKVKTISASKTVNEDWQPGTITVTKKDDETLKTLKDAVLELYAKEDIIHPDGKSGVKYKAGDKVGTFPATDSNGKTSISGLYLGSYYIKEKNAPTYYVLNNDAEDITLTYAGQTVEVSVSTTDYLNHRQEGKITITKHDSETDKTVPNAVYALYAAEDILYPDGKSGVKYKAGDKVGTFPVTSTNGQAFLEHLYLGKYYLQEVTAPEGYFRDDTKYYVELAYAGQTVEVVTKSQKVTDKVQRGTVSLIKEDKELYNETQDKNIVDANGDRAQGDATRKGAVYGLYAKEDIVHKDTKTGVVTYNQTSGSIHEIKLTKGTNLVVKNVQAKAGTLLATASTDANGEIKFEHLYLGEYYIKEITPSEGYLIDTNTYNFSLTYAGQNVEVRADIKKTSLEQVMKQGFEVYKLGINSDVSGVADPLKGAKFTVKLESDVQRMGWDKAPAYDVLTTDDKGYDKSIDLPYGYYRVRETYTPKDYETANDFFITVDKDSRTPQSFTNSTIVDHEYEAMLKIVKKDAETGKTVLLPNAKFKVKALTDVTVDGKYFKAGEYIGYWNWNIFDGFYTDEWETNEDGYVLLNEKLGVGTYQIEELKAPYGYTLNEDPVEFKITTDVFHEVGKDEVTQIIPVTVPDVSVKGKIIIEKQGEVLTGYDKESQQFIYEVRGLADAEYGIYAENDIMDPSNDGAVLYSKDSLVTTVTTGTDGTGVSKEIPLGEYYSKELKAPKGYVLSDEVKHFTLEYIDDSAEHHIVYDSDSYTNERQKVNLDILKQDIETKLPVEGAEFTLFANKDVANYAGEVIVNKGDVVSVAVSDENGKINYDIDLPIDYDDGDGHEPLFVIKETGRPIGYTTYKGVHDVDTVYQGQEKDSFTVTHVIENTPTTTEFTKTDIVTGNPVPGAILSVIPVDDNGEPKLGETFDTWLTEADDPETEEDESVHTIKRLEPGKYILRETLHQAQDLGYVTSNDASFEVSDTGEIQKVNMTDDFTKVEVTKTDIVTGEPVAGAQLSIIPLDDNGEPKLGETFDTWITVADDPETEEDESVHYVEYLPVGDYILRETLQGEARDLGYVTASDVKFTVKDTGEIQKVNMEDDFTKVEITKTDADGNALADATLALIPTDDDGKMLQGETFDTWLTEADDPETEVNENIHRIERIPLGNYKLVELSTPDGYVKAEIMDIEVKDTPDVQEYTMIDKQVTFTKMNVTGTKEVIGGEYEVLDEDGNVIDSWENTDEANHIIKNLEEGKTYTLVEKTAPDGYVIAESITFTVDGADKDGMKADQNIIMKDKQVTFTKMDATGQKEVIGGEYEVLDEDGNVIDSWENTDGANHVIKNLEEGKTYTLVEKTAPDGYVKAENITFTVTGADENGIKINQKVVMNDKQIFINKLDVDGQGINGAKLQIIDEETEKVVDEWISDGNAHTANHLIENHKYVLKEIQTPDGYVKAKDVHFIAHDIKEDQTINMYDKKVTFTKTDITGKKELTGGEYEVLDEDDNIVDSWKNTDGANHVIKNLEEDKTYTLVEKTAPDGYVIAESITFTVTGVKRDQTIVMKDKQIAIRKIDQLNNPVEGAQLQIVDKETNKVVESFVTDGNDYHAMNVEIGKTYILQEIKAPEHYIKAEDVEFTVTANENQTIEMTDIKLDKVEISKKDITTKEELEGAHLEVKDKDGNIIEGWISTKEPHYIWLEVGRTYTLTETIAPDGYKTAETIEFTVDDNGEIVQKIVMYDDLLPVIKVVKTDDNLMAGGFVCLALAGLSGILIAGKKKIEE